MAAQVPFALAPALVGAAVNDPIDYSTRAGQALYQSATEKFPYIFAGKDSSIVTWLQAIKDRSTVAGWTDILDILVGQDAQGVDIFRPLLDEYGLITLAMVRQNAIDDYIGMPVRNAQISTQIYIACRKSISESVDERLVTEATSYTINGVPDGPCFIRTIIELYQVQTKGTTSQLRIQISKAKELIVEKGYDVDAFNTSIDAIVQRLASSGETSEDLFAHLTKAYKQVPDKAFGAYIRKKIDDHNDGSIVLTTSQLMHFAKSKYNEIIKEGEWMSASADSQLVALTAQLEQINMDNKNLKRQWEDRRAKQVKCGRNDKPKGKGPKQGPRTPGAGADKSKWAWKDQTPKPGQHTRIFEGKTYHWCKFHKKWTLHKSAECRLARHEEHRGNGAVRNVQMNATLDYEAGLLDEA